MPWEASCSLSDPASCSPRAWNIPEPAPWPEIQRSLKSSVDWCITWKKKKKKKKHFGCSWLVVEPCFNKKHQKARSSSLAMIWASMALLKSSMVDWYHFDGPPTGAPDTSSNPKEDHPAAEGANWSHGLDPNLKRLVFFGPGWKWIWGRTNPWDSVGVFQIKALQLSVAGTHVHGCLPHSDSSLLRRWVCHKA